MTQLVAIRGIEHQDPTTPCPNEFTTDSAILLAEIIPLVDMGAANPTRTTLLVFPVLIHQFSEKVCIALLKSVLTPQAELLYVVKILEHVIVVLLSARILVLEDPSCVARKTRKEQQQIIFEVEKSIDVKAQRLCVDRVVLVKSETSNTAISRDVLILFADRLAEAIDLDLARQLGKLFRVQQALAMCAQRFQ